MLYIWNWYIINKLYFNKNNSNFFNYLETKLVLQTHERMRDHYDTSQ